MGCGQDIESTGQVHVNIYNMNKTIEMLNWLVLRENEMGIFHCGVEAYSWEWSFMLLPDELVMRSTPRKSGVVRYLPKSLRSFTFSESISVGKTELSAFETVEAVLSLSEEWPASGYHVTRRNCLMFAQALVKKLGLGSAF